MSSLSDPFERKLHMKNHYNKILDLEKQKLLLKQQRRQRNFSVSNDYIDRSPKINKSPVNLMKSYDI